MEVVLIKLWLTDSDINIVLGRLDLFIVDEFINVAGRAAKDFVFLWDMASVTR